MVSSVQNTVDRNSTLDTMKLESYITTHVKELKSGNMNRYLKTRSTRYLYDVTVYTRKLLIKIFDSPIRIDSCALKLPSTITLVTDNSVSDNTHIVLYYNESINLGKNLFECDNINIKVQVLWTPEQRGSKVITIPINKIDTKYVRDYFRSLS